MKEKTNEKGQTLQQVLYINKMEQRKKDLLKLKKQQKKENILSIIIIIFITFTFICTLLFLNNITRKDIENCTKNHELKICLESL